MKIILLKMWAGKKNCLLDDRKEIGKGDERRKQGKVMIQGLPEGERFNSPCGSNLVSI